MESRKIDLQYNNTISISMLENLGNDLFSCYIVGEDINIYFDKSVNTWNQEKLAYNITILLVYQC